jgi:hypothetical protein
MTALAHGKVVPLHRSSEIAATLTLAVRRLYAKASAFHEQHAERYPVRWTYCPNPACRAAQQVLAGDPREGDRTVTPR